MSDQPRPVWLTEAQRNALDTLPSTDLLYDIVAAWDAAPGDPGRAVMDALDACFSLPARLWTADHLLAAVLRSIGHPDVRGPRSAP